MGWYDLFSTFYDRSLEPLYREQRAAALAALDLHAGLSVLDLPVGTGQGLDGLCAAVAPGGTVVGVDLSAGMLGKARARGESRSLPGLVLVQGDVQALDGALLREAGAPELFDRILVFLGMSAFPEPQAAFDRLWERLKPGGRMVVVDVFAERLDFQGRMVNLVARADLRRRSWEPLQAVAEGFRKEDLPSLPQHGGRIFLATGTKG